MRMDIFKKKRGGEELENVTSDSSIEEKDVEKKEVEEKKELKIVEAPLFVKVDKYKEIVATLQEVKTLLSGLRNLFSVLEEIDQVKNDTINTLRITFQKIEREVVELDSNLLKPSDREIEKVRESIVPRLDKAKELEDSLKQLYDELNAMKSEIEKLRNF